MTSYFDSDSFGEVIEITTAKSNKVLIGLLIGGLLVSTVFCFVLYDRAVSLEDENLRLLRRLNKKP